MHIVVPIIIGLIVGGITLAGLLGQLKSVVKKEAATDYVNKGSLQLTKNQDIFLYKHTEKNAVQQRTQPK